MSDIASRPGTTQKVELLAYKPPYATQSAVGTPAPPAPATDETVTITLNGRERTVPKGQLIITAADEAGVYIPRFCYHPRMKPVGMCRMCLVEVVGPRGATLMPACYNTVADGMQINTDSEMTKKAQDGVLELLLVNHPLDCPVCDKGGECPLQDQTLTYGPGESRFVEEKRHWDKPIPLSELVYLDRERCIQCGRCVRFADEVAGDALIDFAERGDATEVATFPDAPYSSYFSGNVVQICPVGALTAKPYRFRARPWDLQQVESTCTSCAFGCRVAVQSSSDELTRYIGVDSDPVNWGWLCDKGRFGFQSVNSPERLRAPMVRQGDEMVEVSWAEALSVVAERIASAQSVGHGEQVALIGGARLANEDAYAWSKTARMAFGTDSVDAQLGDGVPAELLLGLPRATIDQAAAAPVVITLTGDIKEELPVLYLRLRDAATKGQAIIELSPHRTGMTRYATASLRYAPGGAADLARAVVAGEFPAVKAALEARSTGGSAGPSVVVVLGRPSLAETTDSLAEAARLLAGLEGVAFLSGLRRSNVHGALDMGLTPGLLPGRVPLEDGRAWFERQWDGPLPAKRGLDATGILTAASRGQIGALVLLGADPMADFPDAELALRALSQARFVVAIDTFLTASARKADVVLPAASFAERRGTFTNLEGRVSSLGAMVTAPGVAWPDWMIASELAARLGVDLGFSSLDDIWAEIEAVSPLHHGVTYELLSSAAGRDGVLVPVGDRPLATPRLLDPMADPGIATTESHLHPPAAQVLGLRSPRPEVVGVEEEAIAPAEDPSSAEAGAAEPGDAGDEQTEAGSDGTVGSEGDDPELIAMPAMIASSPVAPVSGGAVPAPGSGELRLVAARTLWDAGTAVSNSTSLPGLHPIPVVRIHPEVLASSGLSDGSTVRLSSSRGSLELSAVADSDVLPGSAVVMWNVPGAGVNDLIDSREPVTAVTLSAAEASEGGTH